MRRYSFILLFITTSVLLLSQSSLKFHYKDSTTEIQGLSNIDSIYFANNELIVKTSDKQNSPHPVTSLDSITFCNEIPVLKTISVSTLTQTWAKSGIVITNKGNLNIIKKGVCWSKYDLPTADSSKVLSTAVEDSSVVYMTSLTGGTEYYARAFIETETGIKYGQLIKFRTSDYLLPIVETTSVTYSGNIQALCTGKVVSSGGYTVLTSRGFCWSENRNPTIEDNKVPYGVTNGTYQTTLTFPVANKTYYVRAYATNGTGTSYGNEIAVTPRMGNVTYNLAQVANPTATEKEYYRLIKIAMDSACYYYNRYTTFSANIYVYYNAGIPTAQASYRGSIGFGSNTTYMHVCTAMHEIAHYMGSGTTKVWQDLTINGIYTGKNASDVLKALSGEVLKGDDMHFWPYGLNYRSEVKSAEDYVRHAKIVEAMKKDCGW
jgi:hypothetical protein